MSRPASLAIPLVLGSLLAACSSSGSDKGAAAGKTVEQAATEIGNGIVHLDATILALKELVEKPAPDLTPQFKNFSKSLGQLESTAEEVAALATKIEARSQELFAKWDAQLAAVQNEDIRERSAERREAVSAGFSKIQNEYSEARDEFKPLLSDLRDIRSVLEADLNMDSLKTIEDTVEDAADESASVKESLQELEKKFRELGVRLSRAGPAVEAMKKK